MECTNSQNLNKMQTKKRRVWRQRSIISYLDKDVNRNIPDVHQSQVYQNTKGYLESLKSENEIRNMSIRDIGNTSPIEMSHNLPSKNEIEQTNSRASGHPYPTMVNSNITSKPTDMNYTGSHVIESNMSLLERNLLRKNETKFLSDYQDNYMLDVPDNELIYQKKHLSKNKKERTNSCSSHTSDKSEMTIKHSPAADYDKENITVRTKRAPNEIKSASMVCPVLIRDSPEKDLRKTLNGMGVYRNYLLDYGFQVVLAKIGEDLVQERIVEEEEESGTSAELLSVCMYCGFRSESRLVLGNHMDVKHKNKFKTWPYSHRMDLYSTINPFGWDNNNYRK